VATRHRAGRLKQWLNYMRRVYPAAQQAFDELRLVHDAHKIDAWLAQRQPNTVSAPA
jgi:tRNA-dihydrouridine synthase C